MVMKFRFINVLLNKKVTGRSDAAKKLTFPSFFSKKLEIRKIIVLNLRIKES